jgi:predicted house-cleaning noncanonical NTP pyrophosphatase (MazG superfamily)
MLPSWQWRPGDSVQAMRLEYHKLVRDGIPRIIETSGGQPITRVLDQAGYLAALRAKLIEEAEEAQAASDGQLRSELADVLEVLQALAAAQGLSWEDVVTEAARKRDERGGFLSWLTIAGSRERRRAELLVCGS